MTAALIIDLDQSEESSQQLASAIEDAIAAELSPIIVISEGADVTGPVWVLEDESDGDSMSALQAALDLLDRERSADALLVIDAAHGISLDHASVLIEAGSDTPVVVTKYRYARALPVLLGSGVWQAVMALEETGLFSWIDSHPDRVGEAWVASAPRDARRL